jgi:hypothetical protein
MHNLIKMQVVANCIVFINININAIEIRLNSSRFFLNIFLNMNFLNMHML